MISKQLATILSAERERCNALFAQARRVTTALDPTDFQAFIRESLDPIVVGLAGRIEPRRLQKTTMCLYETGLECIRRNFIGSNARFHRFGAQWVELMRSLLPFAGENPEPLIASLTNALVNLVSTPRVRVDGWVYSMSNLSSLTLQPAQILTAGQVAAWLAGMVQYREQALDAAKTLPEDVLAVLLPLEAKNAGREALVAMARDPWFHPGAAAIAGPRLVAEIGDYRGRGGEFMVPPRVYVHQDELRVTDGEGHWLLMADCFGVLLHRVPEGPRTDAGNIGLSVDASGQVSGKRGKAKIEVFEAGLTSSAANSSMLAGTVAHSHRVFIVAEAQ